MTAQPTMPTKPEPTTALTVQEKVLLNGNLTALTIAERLSYYKQVCESLALNPLTQPFEYLHLDGKLILYARKNCTDQLRNIHNISVTDLIVSQRMDVYIVTAKVCNDKGRTDIAQGAVPLKNLDSKEMANAIMKAETKAKRRATLSICGLSMLDESEVEDLMEREKQAGAATPESMPIRGESISGVSSAPDASPADSLYKDTK